jgi:hypothetical protein
LRVMSMTMDACLSMETPLTLPHTGPRVDVSAVKAFVGFRLLRAGWGPGEG